MFSFFSSPAKAKQLPADVYSFEFQKITEDGVIKLEEFAGKVILLVNTASKCGFTKQYDDLQKLYDDFKDDGLVVIGVPSNDFGGQEPADNAEIAEFCRLNYGVSFPMTAKYQVKGDDAHPFFIYAREKLGFGTAPKWNFHKYLINKNGELIDYFHSNTDPSSDKFRRNIMRHLKSS